MQGNDLPRDEAGVHVLEVVDQADVLATMSHEQAGGTIGGRRVQRVAVEVGLIDAQKDVPAGKVGDVSLALVEHLGERLGTQHCRLEAREDAIETSQRVVHGVEALGRGLPHALLGGVPTGLGEHEAGGTRAEAQVLPGLHEF